MYKTYDKNRNNINDLKFKVFIGRGELKVVIEKDGLFLGNEYGCGRDLDNGLNSCGLDVVVFFDVEVFDIDNGFSNIDVLGFFLNFEVENKVGVEVLIEFDLFMFCLLVCILERFFFCKGRR